MNSEDVFLLPLRVTSRSYFETSFYIKSKAACLILLWNLSVILGYRIMYNIDTWILDSPSSGNIIPIIAIFSMLTAFSPVIGLLTDVKLSRYKSVLCSSYVTLLEVVVLILVLVSVAIISDRISVGSNTILILRIVASSCLAAMSISFVVFLVNAFQFGMDQLHDSSTQELISYIHWYVWLYYASSMLAELLWNLILHDDHSKLNKVQISGYSVMVIVLAMIMCLLTLSLCVFKKKRVWFLIEPAVNPYKLVYRVIRFACQHKVPLKRSAFTYCEDELPSRLDLGKQKYGGPFTTKQVEDVKAFFGILKVLLSVGLAFYLQTVTQSLLVVFAKHSK